MAIDRKSNLPSSNSGDASIQIEATPTTAGTQTTLTSSSEENQDEPCRTWIESFITTILVVLMWILAPPILSYHEEDEGDDDPTNRFLRRYYGRFLFPSTPRMVLVMITFFTLAAVILHRLQPHWMFFNGGLSVITVRLVSDGVSSFIQNVTFASMVMALLCHLSYGIKWLFQQGRQCTTRTRSDEEQPLVVSHGSS
ncbi:hypothetical protein FOXYSP1_04428 [Fusarium oxysporum f. sp. phaseoli]